MLEHRFITVFVSVAGSSLSRPQLFFDSQASLCSASDLHQENTLFHQTFQVPKMILKWRYSPI